VPLIVAITVEGFTKIQHPDWNHALRARKHLISRHASSKYRCMIRESPPDLASKHRRPRDLIGATAPIRVSSVVVNVDLDAGVVGGVRARKADKVLAGVGAGAGDADSKGERG
jgi:hypothetical protein